MRNLREKQHYIDQYDKLTVENCRSLERIHKKALEKELPKPKGKKLSKSKENVLRAQITAHNMMVFFEKGEAYVNQEKTIQKWMERDESLDQLFESAQPQKDIRCLTCRSLLKSKHKHIQSEGIDGKDRVLFMYECLNGCLPHRAFFDDGEEWKRKAVPCSKCQTKTEHDSKRKGDIITTTNTCHHCGHIDKDTFSLSTKEDKKIDKDFLKDRNRFCLSEKEGQGYITARTQMEGAAQFMKDWEEKKKHKKDYDAIDDLKKLTVVDLENLLSPLCKKHGYIRLTFDVPDMGKDIIVPFTAHDSKSERRNRESTYELQKILKKALADTNWRLMSDDCSYRLGFVTGRLRAYEREEDLLKLVGNN